MSTTDAHDAGPEPDTTQAVPTVRCDSCGASVAETATDTVPRRYMSLVIDETWCALCIRSKDEATARALKVDKQADAPDY